MDNKISLFTKIRYLPVKYKILIAIGLLTVISLLYIKSNMNDKKVSDFSGNPQVSPTINKEITINSTEYKRPNTNQAFLINRFNSLPNMIGYLWIGNKIIYATPNGIFDLWKNKQIVSDQIVNLLGTNPNIVYQKTNNTLMLKEVNTVQPVKIGSLIVNPKIDYIGQYILYSKNDFLWIKNLTSNLSSGAQIKISPNIKFDWIPSSQYLYTVDGDKLSVYDTNLKSIKEYKVTNNEDFVGLTSDLNHIITQNNEKINIKNIQNGETQTYNFTPNSTINSFILDESNILVIEKIKRDIYDLYDQYIWIINITNNSNKFLTNSLVIPNKINELIAPKINSDKTAILLSENNGKIWVISLLQSKLPIYNENGISFFTVDATRGNQ